uniref:Uncharacterized protein n=1 Tax=Arundo donax TaxID=35708 RepID=A0A0A9C519_ARUDO
MMLLRGMGVLVVFIPALDSPCHGPVNCFKMYVNLLYSFLISMWWHTVKTAVKMVE